MENITTQLENITTSQLLLILFCAHMLVLYMCKKAHREHRKWRIYRKAKFLKERKAMKAGKLIRFKTSPRPAGRRLTGSGKQEKAKVIPIPTAKRRCQRL